MQLLLCGIYCITNTANGKRYVGSSSHIRKRWRAHRSNLNNGKHQNHHLQAAWMKYGSAAFVFSILEICPGEDLVTREIVWIAALFTDQPANGYNRRSPDRRIFSAQTRALMSAAKKGRKQTAEHAANAANARRGIPLSAETRAKIAAANTGRRQDPEITTRRAAAMRGRKRDPDAVRKGAEKHRGMKRPPISQETRAKMRASRLAFMARSQHTE